MEEKPEVEETENVVLEVQSIKHVIKTETIGDKK